MSQHASSSKLENRAYVLLPPPPPKRNSTHLDCTPLSVNISTRTVTFSPKKRQKISVEIKFRNLDKSQYSSLSGNLNGPLREASPTVSDWARQHPPPISPTISDLEAVEPNSPLFSPTISESNLEPYVDSSGRNSDINSAEWEGSPSTEDNAFAKPCDIVENASLKVPGELAPSLSDSESYDKDDIPVRRIDHFAVFRRGSREMVNITELLPVQMEHSGCQFLASGYISSWHEEEEDDDSDEEDEEDGDTNASRDNNHVPTTEYNVELSTILELNVHALSPSRKALDSKLYIRTEHAWYILGTPHRKYRRFYSLYWLQHRILHIIVVASLLDARITFPRFLEEVPKAEGRYFPHNVLPCAQDIIGRELSEDDVKSSDIGAYVISLLPEVCSSGTLRIFRVPLIRHFMGPLDYEVEPLHSRTSSKNRPKTPRKQKHGKNVEKNVLAHRLSQSKTFLTPLVNQLAERYFHGSLETAEQEIAEELHDNPKQGPKHKMHPYDPKNITLGPYLDEGERIYASVKLDNVQYSVGDVVMVAQDVSEKPNPNETSTNPYANKYWFCQIQYFFRDNCDIMFHAQWFNHGAKTLLQQMAHPASLYYLGTCDDLPVGCIYKMANVTILSIGDPEPPEESEESFNTFHCALQYDVDTGRFADVPPNALVAPTPGQGKVCYACYVREAEKSRCDPQWFDNKTVLHHNGVVYHVKEHVYVHPQSANTSSLLDICQILRFDSLKSVAHVRCLSRMSEYNGPQSKKFAFVDERELYLLDNQTEVPIDQLDGICFVKHLQDPIKIEEWIQSGDDHFYLNQKYSHGNFCSLVSGSFTICVECHCENDKSIERKTMFHKTSNKLVGLELFSGAGGLGLGMELSGAVSTKYAVEFSPSAAATFHHNHPNTTVFCQDTSVLLKRAVQRDAGDQLPTLYSNDGKTVCPDLPSRTTNVDFIFGGPPCQSFSRANHTKRRDDRRSTLPCQMISWVEYYRPKYFLLENVGGIVDHVLYFRAEGDDGKSVEVEIRSGMVKFICRALIGLGYQVHYRQLQAVHYGAPQSRARIIFWGARRGIPLPEFPLPIRGGAKKPTAIKLPNGHKLLPISRGSRDKGGHPYAPFRAVTVKDAIGDLPPFDWKNPATVMGLSQADHAETADRVERLGIPQYDARNDLYTNGGGPSNMKDLPGYPNGAKYHTAPQTPYQKWLRRGMPSKGDVESKLLTGHYTATFKPSHIEATVRVPLEPGASHKMLPRLLIPAHVLPETLSKNILFGRMGNDEYFRCVLTTVKPELKNAWPLHPEQRRIVTVRECARAQGFPDHYVFISKNTRPHGIIEDQIRQIGNAVAVPFALALGKELSKVLLQTWEEHQRDGSPEL